MRLGKGEVATYLTLNYVCTGKFDLHELKFGSRKLKCGCESSGVYSKLIFKLGYV